LAIASSVLVLVTANLYVGLSWVPRMEHVLRSIVQSIRQERKTEDGTILGNNGAFSFHVTSKDEGSNYIPSRLTELPTYIHMVHMNSVVMILD
jgi:hypothetical protein